MQKNYDGKIEQWGLIRGEANYALAIDGMKKLFEKASKPSHSSEVFAKDPRPYLTVAMVHTVNCQTSFDELVKRPAQTDSDATIYLVGIVYEQAGTEDGTAVIFIPNIVDVSDGFAVTTSGNLYKLGRRYGVTQDQETMKDLVHFLTRDRFARERGFYE